MFHPRRVADWLDGRLVYPLYMEISPSGICNHRCCFCAKDYIGYRSRELETGVLLERLTEFAALGVKSILFGGEGEPLLHPDLPLLVRHACSAGIDVAISTNGVLLTPECAKKILPYLSWVKVSIDAGSPETYASIHGTKPGDFGTVLDNLSHAAGFARANRLAVTVGTQALLLPENAGEIGLLAEQAKNAGAAYLVVKPYSQHHMSQTRRYAEIDYTPYLGLAEELERYSDERFKVIFRLHTMQKMHRRERGYGSCLALPFWSYIDAGGDVWGCSSYIGDRRFLYGNILTESFRDIWNGKLRRRSLEVVATEMDPEGCRMNCRMDEINHYLWELTHPHPHLNFI